MLVILAGYPDDMERLINSNQGLASRFPNRFLFPDYNVDELMQIAKSIAATDQYRFTPEAIARLRQYTQAELAQHRRDFGNARWIEQTGGTVRPRPQDGHPRHGQANNGIVRSIGSSTR